MGNANGVDAGLRGKIAPDPPMFWFPKWRWVANRCFAICGVAIDTG